MAWSKARVLVVGGGGVGTMAAYALETGGKASVTLALRSNFKAVKANGIAIDSIEWGNDIKGWRPTESEIGKTPLLPPPCNSDNVQSVAAYPMSRKRSSRLSTSSS